MRMAIAILVKILIVCLLCGFQLKDNPGRWPTVVFGIISEVANGSLTIRGPSVILFYNRDRCFPSVLIAFF